jgi:hypothetical protein
VACLAPPIAWRSGPFARYDGNQPHDDDHESSTQQDKEAHEPVGEPSYLRFPWRWSAALSPARWRNANGSSIVRGAPGQTWRGEAPNRWRPLRDARRSDAKEPMRKPANLGAVLGKPGLRNNRGIEESRHHSSPVRASRHLRQTPSSLTFCGGSLSPSESKNAHPIVEGNLLY